MAVIVDSPAKRILFIASVGMTHRLFVSPLAMRLRADGFEVIAAAGDLGTLEGFDRTYELPPFRRQGAASVLKALRALTRVIERERPALLHLHTPPALALGRLAGRRLGVPSVAIVHGTFLEPWSRRTLLFAAVEGALARLSVHTVTMNDEDAEFYRHVLGSRSVGVAPVGGMGLDLARLEAALQHPRRLAAPPSVVVVGRLTPDKRHDVAVEAFLRFRRRNPRATLTFVGSTLPGEPSWEVPDAPGVKHQPWVPDPYPLIAGADLLLTASPREGFAVAVTEALALGIPVAAVTNRGVRQALRNGTSGLVASGPDPLSLADAIGVALQCRPAAGERERLATASSRTAAIEYHRNIICRVLGVAP